MELFFCYFGLLSNLSMSIEQSATRSSRWSWAEQVPCTVCGLFIWWLWRGCRTCVVFGAALLVVIFAECCVCSRWVHYAFWLFQHLGFYFNFCIYRLFNQRNSIYNPRNQSGGDFVPLSCRRKVTEWALFTMMCCPCHGFSLSLSISPWHFSNPGRTFLLVSLLPMCISLCHSGEIFVQFVCTTNLKFMLFDEYLMHIVKPNGKELTCF